MAEPFIWICLVAANTEGDADPDPRIRAWTANAARAAQLVEQGLDMVPVYRDPPARSSAGSAPVLTERLIQAAVDYEQGRCSSRELAEARAAVEAAIPADAQSVGMREALEEIKRTVNSRTHHAMALAQIWSIADAATVETKSSDGAGENQPEKRTGPHCASGETNSGATGDSGLTRSARLPSDPQCSAGNATERAADLTDAQLEDLRSHIRGSQPSATGTYDYELGSGWRCFHCGEMFRTWGGASLHFGGPADKRPSCASVTKPQPVQMEEIVDEERILDPRFSVLDTTPLSRPKSQ